MKKSHCDIQIARVYDSLHSTGRYRVLVDRLWPRGVSKTELELDLWLKDVAPSAELRKWFNHDPVKWREFRERYSEELDAKPEAWSDLLEQCRRQPVLLLYSAKDEEHNNAAALREYLAPRLRARR